MDNILRICTWNIHLGIELPLILEQIHAHKEFSNLDLLALQESSVHNGMDDAKLIKEALGNEYEYYQEQAHIHRGLPQINALIWNTKRIRTINKEHIKLPHARKTAVNLRDKLLNVLTHSGYRNSLIVEGAFLGKTLRICVTHLALHGKNQKHAQFMYILESIARRSLKDIEIITGDFNTYKLLSRLKSKKDPAFLQPEANAAGFCDITTDIAWTFHYPKLRMKQKLDAIFVKPRPLQYSSWSPSIRGSDHMPVFADITFL